MLNEDHANTTIGARLDTGTEGSVLPTMLCGGKGNGQTHIQTNQPPLGALERDPLETELSLPQYPRSDPDYSWNKEGERDPSAPSSLREDGLQGTEGPSPSARGHLDGRGWAFKALFIVTTCSAQLITQGQFGMVVIPLYEVGAWLGTEEQGQLGWIVASYGLTVGMFLIMSGRLGDL